MKIWLTYAWVDNDDQDVDHVIAELTKAGCEVKYDRVTLLAGQRLWDQIDKGMRDPTIDAWCMFVTENSLKSEPCQEEIAYALDRALRSGAKFPLIGILPAPVDRTILPSAIATRKYVVLRDPTWSSQIVDSVQNASSQSVKPPEPYGWKHYYIDGEHVLEVWPRSGHWVPFYVVVPIAEASRLKKVFTGPKGTPIGAGIILAGDYMTADGKWKGYQVHQPVTPELAAHVYFHEMPSEVYFGPAGSTHGLTLARA